MMTLLKFSFLWLLKPWLFVIAEKVNQASYLREACPQQLPIWDSLTNQPQWHPSPAPAYSKTINTCLICFHSLRVQKIEHTHLLGLIVVFFKVSTLKVEVSEIKTSFFGQVYPLRQIILPKYIYGAFLVYILWRL